MLEALIQRLAAQHDDLTVYSQDDPIFPAQIDVVDDRELSHSYRHKVETVPTLLQLDGDNEVARLVGWDRQAWRALTGITDLGADLPVHRPGCGSRSVETGYDGVACNQTW